MEIVYLNWMLKRYNKTFILCNNREAGIYFTWAFYHDFIQKYFVYLQIAAQHPWFWKNMECKIYLQILREGDEKMLFLFHFFFLEKKGQRIDLYFWAERSLRPYRWLQLLLFHRSDNFLHNLTFLVHITGKTKKIMNWCRLFICLWQRASKA